MGFAHGFSVGHAAVKDAFDQYDKAQIKNGVSDIMNTLPDGSKVKPEEPGMMQKIGDFITGSETPQQKAGDPSKFADAEINTFRNNSLADFFAANGDPEKGMRIKQDALRTEAAQRQADTAARQDALQKDMTELWGQTNMGRKVQDYKQQQQQFNDYQEAIKAGKDPNTLGISPTQPAFPRVSPDEALADSSMMMAVNARHGKIDINEINKLNDAYKNAENEGFLKALGIANSGAPIEKVAEAFNGNGKIQFKPEDVVADSQIKQADGSIARVLKMKDGTEINTSSALKNLLTAKEQLDYAHKAAKNTADIAQSNASAAASLSSIDSHRASAENSRSAAEQNKIETQHMRENGTKMGTAGSDGDKKLGVKDYEGLIKDSLTLDKGDMGLQGDEGKKRQEILERATTYAQHHVKRQPPVAEVMEAGRRAIGEKRTSGGVTATWNGVNWVSDN